MNNLTLFILGLVLYNVPSCFSKCFSESLNPSYPCCKGDKVVYTDKDGDWGVENNKWCGIGNGPLDDSCFSVALGYKCCEKCKVVFTDNEGDWGVENNNWCGIKDGCASDIDIKEPVKDNSEFDFAFLKMENNRENMLYSPLSIKYALKMLQEGADGNTLAQIDKVLENTSLNKYENIDKILSLANGLFIRDKYYKYLKEEYLNTLKEQYDAEVKQDEFKDAKNANQWIEDKTLGIIKNMLEDKLVQDPATVMLLINALAIDMEWEFKFDFYATYGRDFYKDDGELMEATTMSQQYFGNALKYYEDDDLTVVVTNLKDYEGIQFEFMALMPNENLSAFVENVTKSQINEIDKKLLFASDAKANGVIVRIPKFKFNHDLKLKEELIELGIEDAFDIDKADFSKMANPVANDINLYVSKALHKADIEFSEDGIKAAAATVLIMALGATSSNVRPDPPMVIDINKPFMFIIRERTTKDIWFTGTVYEPNLWENDEEAYIPRRVY